MDDDFFVVSSLPPTTAQERLAVSFVLGLLAVFIFITVGPFKGVLLPRIDAFVPIYATAVFVNDLITAILLYAQFSILRSRATLMVASGYLFTAIIMIPYALTFPGVFAPAGIVGGMQTTVWLYVLWHFTFPVFVMAYAWSKTSQSGNDQWNGTVSSGVAVSVCVAVGVVSAVAIICIAGEAQLPRLMLDSLVLGPLWPYAGAPIALVSVTAFIMLWLRRSTMLDLWLMVVMCLYLIEIPLSYYPTPIRFSVAFYAIRTMGILSSSLVLVVMLYEITTLYVRLRGAIQSQRRERDARLMTGDAVAAMIAHEVKQPLTGMVTSADAGLRFLGRPTPDLDEAKAAFQQIVADGHRAGAVMGSIRNAFRKEPPIKASLDLNDLIREALVLVRDDLNNHGITVQAELNEKLVPVMGDRIQFKHVLINLIANAIESMAAVSGLRVLSIGSKIDNDGEVWVSIGDTGMGVAREDLDRVFDPLFTTKTDGMGMGLYICRSIVESHHGRLWVVPNMPRGAVFQFSSIGLASL